MISGDTGPETDDYALQPLHGESDDQVHQIERGVGPSEAVLGTIARKDGTTHDRCRADGGNWLSQRILDLGRHLLMVAAIDHAIGI